MGRRLGLLGGTFDPVHTGHLLMAEVARHALSLDQVVFVPAGVPPHKCEAVTPAEHRYAMVLLATAPNESFAVSRRELERSGPSYSLTTIREYRREDKNTALPICLCNPSAISCRRSGQAK